MFKLLNILLCFLLIFGSDIINGQDNFQIFTPEFVPINENFEISIITSKRFPEAEFLDLFFSTDISLSITGASLLSRNQIVQLPIKNEFSKILNDNATKIKIDLKDTTKLSASDFFQIIISLRSSQVNNNDLRFYGEFKDHNESLGYLLNSELNNTSGEKFIYRLDFDYYQKFPIAGKALLIQQDYYLNVPLTYQFEKFLAVDFWMKIENPVSNFLEIINWETNQIEYDLSVNENQLLTINSFGNENLTEKSFFLSNGGWYHFKLILDKLNSELSFFCDGSELARLKVFSAIDFENLVLHFKDDKQNSEYLLDQLRVIKLAEINSAIERNKNYQDYNDSNSSVLLQINFTELGLHKLLNNKSVFFEKVKFVKSDAPIFPRSPEIDVKMSDNYYEIEWQGGNYKFASKYIVEKATGDNDFVEIDGVAADNNEKKIYSVLSDRGEQSQVVFFRIKQINKDGSTIYSDVVKVGQGIIDDVIIGQNFPNPFNPTTLIEFELLQDSDVEVKVYNLAGKEISVLQKGFLNKGSHQFKFDAAGYPSGVYIYQITTPLSSQTRKMILAK